jgi:hypothetical protein
VDPSPAPLEAYAAAFEDLFGRRNQRHCFRRYLEGLLPPAHARPPVQPLAAVAHGLPGPDLGSGREPV